MVPVSVFFTCRSCSLWQKCRLGIAKLALPPALAGAVVLPGGVSAGEGQTWLLLASESRSVSRVEELWPAPCLG